jgi:hypothetical protein
MTKMLINTMGMTEQYIIDPNVEYIFDYKIIFRFKFNFDFVIDRACQLTSHFTINNTMNQVCLEHVKVLPKVSLADIAKYGDSQELTAADKRILQLMR